MANINFVESFENTSHFNEDALFLIATSITIDAEALGAEGIPDNLYITCCDIDRIYLSTNPEASPDSSPDYVIRMWDYHICEEDRRRVHINSTFHIMKECPDGSGSCSAEQFDGDYDILVYGKIAKMRIAVLNGLTAIQIPDSVTVIPRDAFSCCTGLKEVHIPEGVTTIEPFAFADCVGLREVYIPNSVLSIGTDAFKGCDNLTEISVPFVLNIASAGLEESTNVVIRSNDRWFESICETYGLTGSDDPDEEIRTLTILKNNWVSDGEDEDVDDLLGESIKRYVSIRYRKEWYKNYIGTKKITFDGPTNYKETGEITDEDISAFMSGAWNNFLNYRLKVGHTERQDRFTAFMRDYPQEILDWMHDGWNDEVIPYYFYEGLAKGGEYELYGCSKDEFIKILRSKDFDEQDEEFEYAAVLEEKYGIDYAIEYLLELDCYSLFNYSVGTSDFILSLLSKAVEHQDNYHALIILAYYRILAAWGWSFNVDVDLSIEMYSRLAVMWKKGLITDDWITDDCYGLAAIFDWTWGDYMWEENDYPDCPDEDVHWIWLLRLLETDFANDIADYLKPLLEMVLEKEKDHNWETGKKAIEAFLAKTSNK